MGTNMAISVPMTQTNNPTTFEFAFFKIFNTLSPAEYTSRYVVVTVDSTAISNAATPKPDALRIPTTSE